MGTWLDFLNRAYIRPNALRDRIRRQDTYEAEGVSAGRRGKTREDCPYNEATESEAWNFWVYGCENAGGELAAIQSGEVDVGVYTTGGYHQPPVMMPVGQAVQTGRWKPRYFGRDEVLRMVGANALGGSGTMAVPTVSGGIAIIGEDDDDDESDLRGC